MTPIGVLNRAVQSPQCRSARLRAIFFDPVGIVLRLAFAALEICSGVGSERDHSFVES